MNDSVATKRRTRNTSPIGPGLAADMLAKLRREIGESADRAATEAARKAADRAHARVIARGQAKQATILDRVPQAERGRVAAMLEIQDSGSSDPRTGNSDGPSTVSPEPEPPEPIQANPLAWLDTPKSGSPAQVVIHDDEAPKAIGVGRGRRV